MGRADSGCGGFRPPAILSQRTCPSVHQGPPCPSSASIPTPPYPSHATSTPSQPPPPSRTSLRFQRLLGRLCKGDNSNPPDFERFRSACCACICIPPPSSSPMPVRVAGHWTSTARPLTRRRLQSSLGAGRPAPVGRRAGPLPCRKLPGPPRRAGTRAGRLGVVRVDIRQGDCHVLAARD
jgi:hypothetical protein